MIEYPGPVIHILKDSHRWESEGLCGAKPTAKDFFFQRDTFHEIIKKYSKCTSCLILDLAAEHCDG